MTSLSETNREAESKIRHVPSICEFLSTENPSDPQFDELQIEIIASLKISKEGKAIFQRIEENREIIPIEGDN